MHAAPLPRVAAQLDLGGLGQRHLPRRAARDGARARGGRGVLRRDAAGPRRRRRASTRSSPRSAHELADVGGRRDARARRLVERLALALAGRRCSCATATRPWPTRSAPRGSPATTACAFGTLPPGHRRGTTSSSGRVRRLPEPYREEVRHGDGIEGRAHHRLLDGHRPRDGGASRAGGWPVYATARRLDVHPRPRAARAASVLALDVCDEGSMRAAVERRRARGRAPSACSSTTPATARRAPSRRCRWRRSAASSRPTSSASSA